MLLPDTFLLSSRRIALRDVTDADVGFLYEVYAGTRTEELAAMPWSPDEKRRFLEQQFAAQNHAYHHHYPGAELHVILIDGTPAGRLYVHARPREIRIMDIALLPAFRRQGVGSALLQRVQQAAGRSQHAVTIHVESFNPARQLYERLGFRPVGQNEVYILMEWQPGGEPAGELKQSG